MKNIVSIKLLSTLLFFVSLSSQAATYDGPISHLWGGAGNYKMTTFGAGESPWIIPSSAPDVWVKMTRVFSPVGAALASTNYGSGVLESVQITTKINAFNNDEEMVVINVQEPGSVPGNQVKSLSVWSLSGVDLVTLIMGSYVPGGQALEIVDPNMAGIAAASIVAKRPIQKTIGTVYIFNTATGTFLPNSNIVTEIELL